jgi:hypothetical protein
VPVEACGHGVLVEDLGEARGVLREAAGGTAVSSTKASGRLEPWLAAMSRPRLDLRTLSRALASAA